MIESETLDQLRICCRSMLHGHDLYHVEVDGLSGGGGIDVVGVGQGGTDGEDGIDNVGGELGSEARVKLGCEGGVGDGDEGFTIECWTNTEVVEELGGKTSCQQGGGSRVESESERDNSP